MHGTVRMVLEVEGERAGAMAFGVTALGRVAGIDLDVPEVIV